MIVSDAFYIDLGCRSAKTVSVGSETRGEHIVSAAIKNAIASANAEWIHWGKSHWNLVTGAKSTGFHSDDENSYARYVIDTYMPPFRKAPVKSPSVTDISADLYPWSAVTISHFMLKGGFARKKLLPATHSPAQYATWVAATAAGEFPISEGHSDYIRWAIRARKDNVANASYWGFRIDEAGAKPDVGDLVGYVRIAGMTHAKALKFFDRTTAYPSHTDLVVAKRAGEIDVIGGNVRDSVTKKTLPLNASGQLADTKHFWFVVMKHRP